MDGVSVIFDLDGTMVDTAPDLFVAANKTLDAFGYDPVGEETIKTFVGHGSKAMLKAALEHLGHDLGRIDLDAMSERFIAFYGEAIAVESRPFPGLEDALERFRADRARLGVCTNKREQLSLKLLQALDLDGYFQAIVGADTLAVRKPHPDHLLETIRRVGGDPSNAVLIGDSETDAKTARAANVPFIAVSFGYRQGTIEELEADAVINHFQDLERAIETVRR